MKYLISKSRWLMVLVVVAGAGAGVALLGMPGRREAPPTVAEAAEQSPELLAILDAVAAREAKAQTVRYRWVFNETVNMDAYPRYNSETKRLGYEDGWPAQQRHKQMHYAMVIDGHNAGYQEQGPSLDLMTGGFLPLHRRVAAVDGIVTGVSSVGSEPATSMGPPYRGLYGRAVIDPPLLAHRLLEPSLTFPRHSESPRLGGRGEHDGHPCVILERVDGDEHPVIWRWWLAEDRDYCVVKAQPFGVGYGPINEVKLRYTEDPQVGWRLTGWDVWNGSSGGGTAEVLDYEFNQPVDIHNPGL
ncbi:MAG: hypothetical protein R6V05_11185 [Candidatus Brocadiia bacterium]